MADEISANSWVYPKDQGLYVEPGDFYIDPHEGVANAVISHGHADHARGGSQSVWASRRTLDIMKIRYGEEAAKNFHEMDWGEEHAIGDVKLWLARAGHVLGSAQVVMEYGGERIVYSGDYKRAADNSCENFEVVECDVFITEATFGLPVFRNPSPAGEISKVLQSLERFPERTHVIGAYALGKAQRVIKMLREAGYERPVFLHGALKNLTEYYLSEGIELGEYETATDKDKEKLVGEVVLAPPSAIREQWARRLHDPVVSAASGWMTMRQRARQQGVELPLIISDHADWPDLLRTIEETKCREVWVTHGREDALMHECTKRGLKAKPLSMVGFSEEGE